MNGKYALLNQVHSPYQRLPSKITQLTATILKQNENSTIKCRKIL